HWLIQLWQIVIIARLRRFVNLQARRRTMSLRQTVPAPLKASGYCGKDASFLLSSKTGFPVFGALVVILIAAANASPGVAKLDCATAIGLEGPSAGLNMAARDLQNPFDFSKKLSGDNPDVFALSSMSDRAGMPI